MGTHVTDSKVSAMAALKGAAGDLMRSADALLNQAGEPSAPRLENMPARRITTFMEQLVHGHGEASPMHVVIDDKQVVTTPNPLTENELHEGHEVRNVIGLIKQETARFRVAIDEGLKKIHERVKDALDEPHPTGIFAKLHAHFPAKGGAAAAVETAAVEATPEPSANPNVAIHSLLSGMSFPDAEPQKTAAPAVVAAAPAVEQTKTVEAPVAPEAPHHPTLADVSGPDATPAKGSSGPRSNGRYS